MRWALVTAALLVGAGCNEPVGRPASAPSPAGPSTQAPGAPAPGAPAPTPQAPGAPAPGAQAPGAPAASAPAATPPAAGTSDPAAAAPRSAAPAAGPCSARGLSAELPDQDLPPPVAAKRRAIAAAAVACDYAGLARLAAPRFTYSFGGGDDPVAHWRAVEARGEPVLATLVKVLRVRPARTPEALAWPAAARENSDRAWKEVQAELAISDQDRRKMVKGFGSYVGWRVFITPAGDWTVFVAGD